MFRRIIACFLICCLLFSTFATFEVKASTISFDSGVEVGIDIISSIGSVLVGLGLSAGKAADDFWDLAESIAVDMVAEAGDDIDDYLCRTIENGSNKIDLLMGWMYDNSYYFSEKVVSYINRHIFTGTESYDSDTGKVVSTAPVTVTKTFADSVAATDYDVALGFLFNNYPDIYAFASTAPYCIKLNFDTGAVRYVFSDNEITYELNSEGKYVYYYNTNWTIYSLFLSADGGVRSLDPDLEILSVDSSASAVSVVPGVVSYKANKDFSLGNISDKLESLTYPFLTVTQDTQDSGDDSGTESVRYYPVSLCSSQSEVEDLTQEAAQSGEKSEPSISVDLETQELVDANGSNLAEKLESSTYPYLTVIEGGQDPDDGSDNKSIPYYPASLRSSKPEVEELEQEDAQSGEKSEPSIAVDLETEELVDANGSTGYWAFGKQVGVDAETALASALISLGVQPGLSDTAFKELVSALLTLFGEEYFFEYESYYYGTGKVLKSWLYDERYTFSWGFKSLINRVLHEGFNGVGPILGDPGFVLDPAFQSYDIVVQSINSRGGDYLSIFEDARYLYAARNSSGYELFVFSKEPITYNGKFKFTTTGPSFRMYVSPDSTAPTAIINSTPGKECDYSMGGLEVPFVQYCIRGKTPLIDVTLSDCYEDLNDHNFDEITVNVDGTDTIYYPVKLFPTVEDTLSSNQNEIQTDYENSVPNISVDEESGQIIEVNRDPVTEEVPDSTTAPEVDPDPTTAPEVDPDPTTAPEIDPDPTTAPEVNPDPTTAPEVDPDPTTAPGTGTDEDTDTEPDTSEDEITALNLWDILKRMADYLLDGFKKLLQLLVDWILTGIQKLNELFEDGLLAGIRQIIEWLSDTLLGGIRQIIEWLADALLTGIETLFVPKTDFLTEKIESLCLRFSFAESIVTTIEILAGDLSSVSTEPPVIYIDLGAAEGSYYLGTKVPFIDLRWYAEYKPTVDTLLSALLWVVFLWRVFVKLPGIISGMPGDFVMDGLNTIGLSESLPARKKEYEIQRQSNRRL